MTARVLIQDPPLKAQISGRDGMVARVWLAWFDSITRRCRALFATATVDPPNIASGGAAQATVTVEGARAGDLALASFETANAGIVITANVTADNTVTVTFLNVSGGAIDLASGTLRVRVEAWQ